MMDKDWDDALLRDLREELDALLLRIAFAEAERDELSALLRREDEPEDPSREEAATQKTLALIEKQFRKKHRRALIHKTLPRTGRAAAAALLVFFIGLSTAVATVQSVRVKLLNFIVSIEERYTELQLSDSAGAFMDVPADWRGSYFPAYIPEGFTIDSITNGILSVNFSDANGNTLSFFELDSDTYTNIDTENASNRLIFINGISALLSEKDGNIYISWAIDNRYFIISYSGARDTAIEIVKSVKMIK